MTESEGFIEYIKTKIPAVWDSLESAAQEGLVYIDLDCDAVTASNRLLLTYPDLHEVLSTLINQWAESADSTGFSLQDILNEEKADNGQY
ncbi:hypothetical protein [Desulforhopalus sp. 52FAK]